MQTQKLEEFLKHSWLTNDVPGELLWVYILLVYHFPFLEINLEQLTMDNFT